MPVYESKLVNLMFGELMKKMILGIIALAITSSLYASDAGVASYIQGAGIKSYCDTKWTMTFWKENENGQVCKKIGKEKWMQSCFRAYSKIDRPTRDQITKVAKKQWKLK